ncbi:MAG: HEPN domain-containing protein [Bacteroidota bacterium]|nr:HEPN domain-containing protein [Bacteroidota bacterium]
MKFLTNEWLNAAELDFKSANQLLQDESLTSVVTFHCQQTIEKLFKAVLVENGKEPQRIHDLLRLYKLVLEFIDPLDDILLLKIINEAYIDTRYPGEIGLLPDGAPSKKEASVFVEFTKLVFFTVKNRLED